jgi:hypothetical protein
VPLHVPGLEQGVPTVSTLFPSIRQWLVFGHLSGHRALAPPGKPSSQSRPSTFARPRRLGRVAAYRRWFCIDVPRERARKDRVLLVGTRSADHIRASSQSGCIQRPKTWLHPNASLNCQIHLATRAPSIHGMAGECVIEDHGVAPHNTSQA